jgi:amino acid transporter
MVAFYVVISLGLFLYAGMLAMSAVNLRKRGREKGPSARSMVLACVVTVIFGLLMLGRVLPPVQAMLPMQIIVPVMFVALVAYMISMLVDR